jgi:hypothetical protein
MMIPEGNNWNMELNQNDVILIKKVILEQIDDD